MTIVPALEIIYMMLDFYLTLHEVIWYNKNHKKSTDGTVLGVATVPRATEFTNLTGE